ncbi:hypothetical protein NEILACOT_05122 [Neisseria lactamica ATCC 23970]|uniref:Uncharacterized protein n=1 Tax=Neisseria lactamica ATCC 23970 TaxID=546265 RepID=D0WC43_NEILA|nr:hypothetical protein NEILACOT_05122 [Neisseria lactamica ATCC 23970]
MTIGRLPSGWGEPVLSGGNGLVSLCGKMPSEGFRRHRGGT